jgi:acetolactate synthase-1/2/3 large subunit
VSHGLPVVVAILHNGYLGMVRQWQQMFFKRRYSSTCLNTGAECPPQCSGPNDHCPVYHPDFVKLAEAYGAKGLRVTREEDIEPALREAAACTDRPTFIDFIVDREFNVFPMVAPGAGISEMILEPEGGKA